jgi:hypothetical protein
LVSVRFPPELSVLGAKNGMFRGEMHAPEGRGAHLTSVAEHRKPESLPSAEISAVWAYTPKLESNPIET